MYLSKWKHRTRTHTHIHKIDMPKESIYQNFVLILNGKNRWSKVLHTNLRIDLSGSPVTQVHSHTDTKHFDFIFSYLTSLRPFFLPSSLPFFYHYNLQRHVSLGLTSLSFHTFIHTSTVVYSACVVLLYKSVRIEMHASLYRVHIIYINAFEWKCAVLAQ